MTELKKNNQQLSWVDAETACKLLNISIKTLKNKCYAHQLNYKIIKTGNKSIYYINKDSISEVCKTNNTDTSKSLIKKYSDAPNWAKVQAEKYLPIIKESLCLKGSELKAFVLNYNNDDGGETVDREVATEAIVYSSAIIDG